MKTERGQAAVVFGLVVLFVIGLVFFVIAGSLPGMKAGADAIGNTLGDAIDAPGAQAPDLSAAAQFTEVNAFTGESYAYDQAVEDMAIQLSREMNDGLVMAAWLSNQKIYPNRYAAAKRPVDSWAATNCYNNNGFAQVHQVLGDDGLNWDLHGLCFEKSTNMWYDVILRRRGTSNDYDFINAFAPKDGILSRILYWLRGKPSHSQINPPTNIRIFIDGIAP